MQSVWRIYFVSALVACIVAVITTLVSIRLFGPAVAPSPDSASTTSGQQPTIVDEGIEEIHFGKTKEVKYKVLFASPPNLTFPDGLHRYSCAVEDQKAGGFVLRRAGSTAQDEPSVAKIRWKAEGPIAK